MQSSRHNKNLLVWVLYFLMVLAIALPKGLNTRIDIVGLTNTAATSLVETATVADTIAAYDMGDAGTYARMGVNLSLGKFTEYEYWRLRLFAPGDTFIEAICLRLFGASFAIVLFFTVLTCACWASVLFNLNAIGEIKGRPYLTFALPLLLLCNGLIVIYFLRKGIMLSESLSTAGLALSFLYLVRSLDTNRMKFAIWSGVFLAFAAYMRAQNELVGLVLILFGGIGLIAALIYFWRSSKLQRRTTNLVFSFYRSFPALLVLLIALTAFNALTIPYRMWNLKQYKSMSWLQWDHYWEANWRDEEVMKRDNDLRLIEQGETVAARVNPVLAAKIREQVNARGPFAFPDEYYKASSITTFLRHPRIWLILKYPAMLAAWTELNVAPYVTDCSGRLHIEHWVFFMLVIFCLVRFGFISLFVKWLKGRELFYFCFYAALFGANLATTIFIHLEPRYYYTLKIMSLVMFLAYFLSSLAKYENARVDARNFKLSRAGL